MNSLLDQDLYTFTVGQAILELYPNCNVSYNFINRGNQRFNTEFLSRLQDKIDSLSIIRLTDKEYTYLQRACPYLKTGFLSYLQQYKFDPSQVQCRLVDDNLDMKIRGSWLSTIFWEVPLLSLVNETYFETIDTDWSLDKQVAEKQDALALAKGNRLNQMDVVFTDFGTRRRRNFESQSRIVRTFKENCPKFVGTSNVKLAMDYGIKPLGTVSHQWIMAHSILKSHLHANKFSLEAWNQVYQGDLGTALTDTYGTDAFYKDFCGVLSRLFDSVRHDSGCPLEFVDKTVAHYKKMRIDPMSKTIIFSDGLDLDIVEKIHVYCRCKIKDSYGIGTFFTNDYPNSPALKVVIKLDTVDGYPVVKLGDGTGKNTGNEEAVNFCKWLFSRKNNG